MIENNNIIRVFHIIVSYIFCYFSIHKFYRKSDNNIVKLLFEYNNSLQYLERTNKQCTFFKLIVVG